MQIELIHLDFISFPHFQFGRVNSKEIVLTSSDL